MFNNQDLTQEMPRLEKFALKLTRNKHDAEDLLQSTVLRAIEKKHLFKENSDLFKWTSKMMYNLFVSGYRRKVKFESQYDPESYLENHAVEASQDIKVELTKVKEVMQKLSDDHKEVLIMVCTQGMRYQDVAKELDIPVGTVRSRLSRAREQLQALMDTPSDEGYSMPGTNGRIQDQRHAFAA